MIGKRLNNKKKMEEKIEKKSESFSTGRALFQKEIPELERLLKESCPQAKLFLNRSDIMHFKVDFTPGNDSYWYGGKYTFTFEIKDDYPYSAPKVMCLTKIYHPNIDYQGNVCLNILKDDWKPTISVGSCIASVYYLFTQPNPNDPLNHEVATVMRENLETFKQNVKKTLRGGYCFGENFPYF